MADFYADIPELDAERAGILKRKKIAEMIQAQSMRPIETPQAGAYVVPTSPLVGIGKIIEAYLGKKAMDEADVSGAELGQKAQGMLSAEKQKVADAVLAQQEMPRPSPTMEGPMPGQAPTLDTQNQRLTDLNLRFPQAERERETRLKTNEAIRAREDMQEQQRLTREAQAIARAQSDAERAQLARDRLEWQKQMFGMKQDAVTEKAQAKQATVDEGKVRAAELGNKSFDDLIYKIDQLIDVNDPATGKPLPEAAPREGFVGAFGQLEGMVPNWARSDKNSAALKTLESIQAQETMRGLADAKEKVGQSFGSMQVKEWDRFTNLIRSLDPTQPDKSLLKNLSDLRKEAIAQKQRLNANLGSSLPVNAGASAGAGITQQPTKRIKFDANGNMVQ